MLIIGVKTGSTISVISIQSKEEAESKDDAHDQEQEAQFGEARVLDQLLDDIVAAERPVGVGKQVALTMMKNTMATVRAET